jgi:NADPH-dependent glutamate synthase beta subunit-like oxidoreductase
MAAWELGLRGYSVTVYEAESFLGGQIATIPKYHQGDDDLALDLARFGRLDITFINGKRAGVDFTPESLLKGGYLAVFVAIGAWDPRALGIPGEELPGVFSALPFLLAVNQGPEGFFGRKGRKVIVIGGGDVGMDAARSGLRLSRKGDVTVVYRRTKEDMPAGEEEKTGGAEEGINFLFQRAPVKIVGRGHVEGVVVQRTEPGPPDPKGKATVVNVPGTEETLPCDTVIIAAGETADVSRLSPELNFKFSSQGWPEGRREGWMTDIEGVFACGGKSVVYAMAAGTAGAIAIDAYIQKKSGRPPTPRADAFGRAKVQKLPEGYGGPTWHL